MTAGAGAGLVASIITCPLDVIKTRLQAQAVSRVDKGYEGAGRTVGRIWAQSGVRGFYRGLGPTLGGYLPTWGIYFTVYDEVKDRLGNWGNVTGGESRERGESVSSSSPSWLRENLGGVRARARAGLAGWNERDSYSWISQSD